MLGMESGVLFCSLVSCCSLLCMIFRARSTGTEVKRSFTSCVDMVSPIVFGWTKPPLQSAEYF